MQTDRQAKGEQWFRSWSLRRMQRRWTWRGTCRFDDAPHGPPLLACRGPGTKQTQDANQDWNQVLGSMSLWAMQPSVKALASEAQEEPMRHRFEDLGELMRNSGLSPKTLDEFVPLPAESLHSIHEPDARSR